MSAPCRRGHKRWERWCLDGVERQAARIKLGGDYYDEKGRHVDPRGVPRSRDSRFPVIEVDALHQRLEQQANGEARRNQSESVCHFPTPEERYSFHQPRVQGARHSLGTGMHVQFFVYRSQVAVHRDATRSATYICGRPIFARSRRSTSKPIGTTRARSHSETGAR